MSHIHDSCVLIELMQAAREAITGRALLCSLDDLLVLKLAIKRERSESYRPRQQKRKAEKIETLYLY